MKKGFTLIELLIVIGILAILATVVVLVLNPAQLLAQARDSQRISDLSSVKSAIALYLSTATSAAVAATARSSNSAIVVATCGTTGAASSSVDGTGWVAINLTQTSGGSALSALPNDPTNSATYQYIYMGNVTAYTFELDGNLESTKYAGLEGTDGGDTALAYEVGTSLTLCGAVTGW